VGYGDKGARSEKVVISKDGNTWKAVRDDDPGTVYELAQQNVEDLQRVVGAIKQYQPPKPDTGSKDSGKKK
jgi:hypothetical protein